MTSSLFLSPNQISLLKEGYERHQANGEAIGSYYTQTAKRLISAGFFATVDYVKNDKKYCGFVITEAGIQHYKKIVAGKINKTKKKAL